MKRKKSFSSDRRSVFFLEHTRSLGQKSNNFARRKNKTVLQSIKTFTEFFFYPFALCDLKDEKKVLSQTKICPWFSPNRGLDFTMLPLGSFKARLQVCACPVCVHLTILNNVVIYLLTLKANRYYLQRLNRNSAGRIKIVDRKALDLVLCNSTKSSQCASWWASGFPIAFPPGCPHRTAFYPPKKPPTLLLPRWVLRENRQNALFVARC